MGRAVPSQDSASISDSNGTRGRALSFCGRGETNRAGENLGGKLNKHLKCLAKQGKVLVVSPFPEAAEGGLGEGGSASCVSALAWGEQSWGASEERKTPEQMKQRVSRGQQWTPSQRQDRTW